MSVKKHLADITAALADSSIRTPRPRGSGAIGAPVQLAQFSAGYQQLEAELERRRAAEGRSLSIALEELRASPFQFAALQPERVEALVRNLAENRLNTPIVVRRVEGMPGYEILSGHHRSEAYRQLGRSQIEAVLVDFSDDEARALVFFDNLLAPELSDYHKYLGFAQLRKATGMTLEALARKSGLSKSQVASLLAFERLPEAALALIESAPATVGARLAEELGKWSAQRPEAVVEAVRQVTAGQIRQAQALKLVADAEREPMPADAAITIRQGRQVFAQLNGRGAQLTLKFASEAQRRSLQARIETWLREQAQAGGSGEF